MTKGAYVLHIKLKADKRFKIGKKGFISFKKGHYIYIGSAMNSLEARIARHKKKDKNKYWHIDYLLEHAMVFDVNIFPSKNKEECSIAKMIQSLPNATAIIGFGSSDCKCKSHLYFFEELPNHELFS